MIAASIIAPDSIWTSSGPALLLEPIIPALIIADTISPELVCAKYISSTELEMTFNENISSVDQLKISLTDDNDDPIQLTGDPVLIEDNLVTVITESTGEDTGFSIENTNVGLDLASGAVLDEAGNPNPGYTDEMVSDGQDPELLSARFISSTQIEMNFSEEFDLVFPENISLTNDTGVPIGIYGCDPGYLWNVAILTIESIGDDPSFNISNESQGLDLYYFAVTDTAGDPDAGIPPNVNDEVLNIPVGDGIPPSVSAVSILSSNEEDNTIAITGDDINISFTASEPLFETPGVMIAGQPAAVSHDGLFYNATYTVQPSDADGPVAFSIDYADLAGNAGPRKTSTDDGSFVMIDQSAPPGLALISPAEGFINDTGSVSFNFTACDDEDEDVDYRLFINGVENTTGNVTCGGYETVDLFLNEGEYNWSVTIWDSTWKYNSSNVLNFTVDTEAPELMLISPEEGTINETGSVTFNFTAFDTVDDTLDYSLFINGIENKTGTIDSGCFESLTVDFADGEYNWSVIVSDASEKYNSSSVLNFTVDTEAPELALIAPEEECINDTGTVTFNFTAFDIVDEDLDYTLFINGIENTSGTIVCGDYENVDLSFADGEYNWSVTVWDSSGKLNESNVLNFTVDTEAPELALIAPEEEYVNDTGSVSFNFTAFDIVDEDLDYTLFINGIENTSGTIVCGDFENVDLSFADGEYNWSVTVCDSSGKYNSSSVLNFTVDTEAPELALIAPGEECINDTGSVTFSFTAFDIVDEDLDYTLFINGIENTSGTIVCGDYENVPLSLDEGEYNWSVTVLDSSGKLNESSVLNFTVDTTAPELFLVAPEDEFINDSGLVTFNFTAFDIVDDTLDYTLFINGIENTSGTIDSGCFETVDLSLVEGDYNWSVTVSDASEKYNSSNVLNLTVDTTAPELALVAPEDEFINDSGSVTFNFTAFDTIDDTLDYALFINGIENTSGTIDSGCFETLLVDFVEGDYNWSVTVCDASGKYNSSSVLNFTVDTEAPELALVAPEDESINDTGSVTFNFTAFDTVDDTLDYSLFINGIENTSGTIDSACFENVAIGFADGDYNWSVTVCDASGKYNDSSILNFTVDTEAPELMLLTPEEGAINDTGLVTFNFTAFDSVDDTLDYTLFINGEVNRTGNFASETQVSIPVLFADGEYNWSVAVRDDAFNANISEVFNFTVDTKAPELVLAAPEEGAINDTGSVAFTFSASDNVDELINYTLFINGEVNRTGYLASGTSVNVPISFTDGEYNWSVAVRDDAFNANISEVFNFTVDTEAPELILVAPEEGSINDTSSVTFTFGASDNVDELINYTLFINEVENSRGTLSSGSFETVSLELADGEYNWSVAVRDDAFNANISEVCNFTVDTEAPELMVMSPEEGAINDTGSVTFTFGASDNVDELINYTLFINGEVNRTGLLSSGVSDTVSLNFADGTYNWSVAVHDDAFNTNISEVFNFTVDTEAPGLMLMGPEEGAINDTGSVTFTFSASDNVDELINYTLFINGVENSTGTLSSGSSEIVSLDFADGEYNWSVSVWDDAINTNVSDVLNFTVDTVAPELTLVVPEDEFINDTGSVTFNFTASDNVDDTLDYTLFVDGEVNRTGNFSSGAYVNVPVSFADGRYNWSLSVWDDAINTGTSEVLNFTVDTVSPGTSVDAPEGKQDTPFWVNFTATDADPSSGIKSTYYKFEGEEGWTAGDSVYIDVDGVHNISYYSEDFAGNRELAKLVRVELDTSPVLEDLQLVPSTILNNSADTSIVSLNVTDPSGTGIMKVTIDLSPIGGASEVEMSSPDGVLYTYGISTDQVGEFSFNVSATNNNEVNPTSTVHLPPLTVIAADDVHSEFGGNDGNLSPSEVGSVVTGTTVSDGVKYATLSAYFNADGWDLL
ncbi:OmpL47-type beta-barrel domain-containing protein [Methanosarcina sp. Mfa9]|uniref:OmpL47-type beta-barrel domain-containing protein n=1 Tax=Methanosarcina sp. Mfa9 TaxID=3439063 RepID=UPI003F8501B4